MVYPLTQPSHRRRVFYAPAGRHCSTRGTRFQSIDEKLRNHTLDGPSSHQRRIYRVFGTRKDHAWKSCAIHPPPLKRTSFHPDPAVANSGIVSRHLPRRHREKSYQKAIRLPFCPFLADSSKIDRTMVNRVTRRVRFSCSRLGKRALLGRFAGFPEILKDLSPVPFGPVPFSPPCSLRI